MGYRCPVCTSDFGIDKTAWRNHIDNCHDGYARDIVNAVKDVTEKAVNNCLSPLNIEKIKMKIFIEKPKQEKIMNNIEAFNIVRMKAEFYLSNNEILKDLLKLLIM